MRNFTVIRSSTTRNVRPRPYLVLPAVRGRWLTGISVTLPRLIGQQAANLLLYTGRRLNGEQALQIGLVDVLTDQDNLRSEAIKLAREIAENAPLAVASVRATMRHDLAAAVVEATEHELAEQQWLRATDDAGEGIRAVSERRPGNFTGK